MPALLTCELCVIYWLVCTRVKHCRDSCMSYMKMFVSMAPKYLYISMSHLYMYSARVHIHQHITQVHVLHRVTYVHVDQHVHQHVTHVHVDQQVHHISTCSSAAHICTCTSVHNSSPCTTAGRTNVYKRCSGVSLPSPAELLQNLQGCRGPHLGRDASIGPQAAPLDGDDACPVCWEPLASAPAIQLTCNHVCHLACAQEKLKQVCTPQTMLNVDRQAGSRDVCTFATLAAVFSCGRKFLVGFLLSLPLATCVHPSHGYLLCKGMQRPSN